MANNDIKTKTLGLLLATTLMLGTPWAPTAHAENCGVNALGDHICADANSGSTAVPETTQTNSSSSSSSSSQTTSTQSKIDSVADSALKDALITTGAGDVPVLTDAEIEADIDELSKIIEEIIDELDPELKTPLANAIASSVTTLGEVFKEQIREGKITKEQAEEKLRALVEEIISQANQLDDVAEEEAEGDPDAEKALDEKKEENISSFIQDIYHWINEIVKDPHAPVPSAGASAGGHNGTFDAKWDGPGTPSGKLSLFMGKSDYYSPNSSTSIVDGDYAAEYARFKQICHSKGDGKTADIDQKLFKAMDVIADLIEQQGYKDVRYALTSCYRSPAHNSAVGGAKGSQHMKGTAMDVKPMAINAQNRKVAVPIPLAFQAACLVMNQRGKGGNGKYASFTHVDTRGYRAVWPDGAKAECTKQKVANTPTAKALPIDRGLLEGVQKYNEKHGDEAEGSVKD